MKTLVKPVNRLADLNGAGKKPQTRKADVAVSLPELDIKNFIIELEGTSSLIVHKFSEKAKGDIADKQQKKAVAGRKTRDPHAEYLSSLYTMDWSPATGKKGEEYGVPVMGFKKAFVSACRFAGGIPMRRAFSLFFITDAETGGDVAKISGGKPEMRTDMVRIGAMKDISDIRYRAEFKTWKVKLRIEYNAATVSVAQILNLAHHAGFHVGWGDMRPEKGGHSHGQWKLVNAPREE